MVDQERARTGKVTDAEYLADYPNAEVNADRAEDMARPGKKSEEEVIFAGKAALLSQVGDVEALKAMGANSNLVNGSTGYTTEQFTQEAVRARKVADRLYEREGVRYDEAEELKSDMAALASGKTVELGD